MNSIIEILRCRQESCFNNRMPFGKKFANALRILFVASLILLQLSCLAVSIDPAYWDKPYDKPQYLLHPSSYPPDSDWFLNPNPPKNGVAEIPLAYGGSFNEGIDQSLGPFNTPRDVCAGITAAGKTGIKIVNWVDCKYMTTQPSKPSNPEGGVSEPAPEIKPDLNLSIPDNTHPLAIEIKVTENGKPVPNAKLKVHAFDMPDNDKKLAEYFLASSCTNCFWGTKGDKKVGLICEGYKPITPDSGGLLGPTSDSGSPASFEPNCPLWKTPLEVSTDGNGMAELEFFLDLAKLGDLAPQKGKPLSVPVSVEYWSEDGGKKIAEEDKELKTDYVGLVEGITYAAPPELDSEGNTIFDSNGKQQKTGDLANYYDPNSKIDPRTSTGLKGSDRARILEEGLLPRDVSTGRALKVGDVLHVGDKILINAENMVTISRGMSLSGDIWVRVRFLDGFVGKVGVSGNVPSHVVVIGKTPKETGFIDWATKFIYFAMDVNEVTGTVPKPKSEAIKAVVKTVVPEASPIYQAYSTGGRV